MGTSETQDELQAEGQGAVEMPDVRKEDIKMNGKHGLALCVAAVSLVVCMLITVAIIERAKILNRTQFPATGVITNNLPKSAWSNLLAWKSEIIETNGRLEELSFTDATNDFLFLSSGDFNNTNSASLSLLAYSNIIDLEVNGKMVVQIGMNGDVFVADGQTNVAASNFWRVLAAHWQFVCDFCKTNE